MRKMHEETCILRLKSPCDGKSAVIIGRNLPDNLSIFPEKVNGCKNNYDSFENKKDKNACFD